MSLNPILTLARVSFLDLTDGSSQRLSTSFTHFLPFSLIFRFQLLPFNTYLPYGDTKFTTFGSPNFDDALANNVCSVLQTQHHNKTTIFVVNDVQLFSAKIFNFN
ncbi:hypothetical protein QQP08_005574 [Theobroma cacao]|nr:hypothetical protein QQP08_005574 [Theobroma cacao]